MAPIINTVEILVGSYTDADALPPTVSDIFFYEVYGRHCDGTSNVN